MCCPPVWSAYSSVAISRARDGLVEERVEGEGEGEGEVEGVYVCVGEAATPEEECEERV